MTDTAVVIRCNAVTSKGKCNCSTYSPFAQLHHGWEECVNCTHTVQNHGLKQGTVKAEKTAPERPKLNTYASKPSVASVSPSGEYTPAELRQALKNAGEPVGLRGRLSPEQKSKAYQILGGK